MLDQLLRLPYTHGLWARFPIGPVHLKVHHGIYDRPHYAFGVYWAALNARQLGIPRISVIEFGVAGGRGLIALQRISLEIETALGIGIDVVGFDGGQGLPKPQDYRDLPHVWQEGFYPMKEAELRGRLTRAQLILGDVQSTTAEWVRAGGHAPLGFIAFDLDYYSSTKDAFTVFEQAPAGYLPRVICYFDDVASSTWNLMNEYVGELLAIREFNDSHPDRKIAKIEQLRLARPRWENWQEKMFAFHDFAHPLYTRQVEPNDPHHTQLPL